MRNVRVRQRNAVAPTAAAGDSCRVLYLRLDDLQVKLLGLDLNASTVTVRIQGEDQRVLGRLFCRLAQAIRLRDVTRRPACRDHSPATADHNGGVLGATLCRLANGQANG